MTLQLSTITFDHDPLSPSTSALNIRRNKDFEVPIPEYDSSIPRTPAESCAAFAKLETTGNNVTIRVHLTIPAAANVTYEVKASGGGVLGKLDPVQVVFSGGVTDQAVDIPLAHRNFPGISRMDITWNWRYRAKGGSKWHHLATTSHRIYVVLAVPPSPWTQVFADKRNPWTDLLDQCCVIASGSVDAPSAAERTTKDIHLNHALRYDIVNGVDRYGFALTGDSFDLTNWIDYVLLGNAPANPLFCGGTSEQYRDFLIVNCYDCAASNALMAKVLGAGLDYYFHQPFGYLNYVLPIGRGKCNNPFYGCLGGNPAVGPDDPRTGFGNHAYPKLNGVNNFDACMRVWLPSWLSLLLFLLWLIILIITLGLVNLNSLLLASGGWLIDISQTDYATKVIDVSQPFEAAAAAGGMPVLQTLQFRIV
jgi:hypothetical protein